MNPTHEPDDLIDLGTASAETKGGPIGMEDYQGGRKPWPGLSDD